MPWDPLLVNDFIRIRSFYQFVGQEAAGTYENIYDFKVVAQGVGNDGYDAAKDQWLLDINPSMRAAQSDQLTFIGLSITRLIPTQVQAQKFYTFSLLGLDPATSEPGNVAVQLNRQTLRKGPRGNGKLFVVGVPNNAYSIDTINGVYRATLNTLAANLAGTMTHASGYIFDPHVLHYDKALKVWQDSGLIELVSVNDQITSLISRRSGRGS